MARLQEEQAHQRQYPRMRHDLKGNQDSVLICSHGLPRNFSSLDEELIDFGSVLFIGDMAVSQV